MYSLKASQLKMVFSLALLGIFFSMILAGASGFTARNVDAAVDSTSNIAPAGDTQTASSASITVDVDKVRFGIGEIVHIFGKAYSNSTNPWTGKMIIELRNSNNDVVYKTSLFPVNGTYRADIQNTLQLGKYIVNVSLDNTNESSWTSFETVSYWDMWAFYSIIGGILCIGSLAAIHSIGVRNIRLIEVANFVLFSGIVLSVLLTIFFADIDLGPNSPIGLVLQHPVDGQGRVSSNIFGLPQSSAQWIVNVGGNQRNNYQDGIAIPVYVVVFGLIGGYLRFLYEIATNRRNQILKEFKRIENEVERMPDSMFEFRELSVPKQIANWFTKRFTRYMDHEIKAVKINPALRKEIGLDEKGEYDDEAVKVAIIRKQLLVSLRRDEMYREKHKFYFYHTIKDLSLLFLAPVLTIVVWFLLAQAGIQGENSRIGGQTGIFILAVASFTVGFITPELVQTLIRFSTRLLELMSRRQTPEELESKSLVIYIVDKPANIPLGAEVAIKIKIINKKSGEIVPGAKVTGIILSPSNVAYLKLPQKLSNLDGDVEYIWIISKDSQVGTYLVNLNAEIEGYESASAHFNFTVLEPEQPESGKGTRARPSLKSTNRSSVGMKQTQTQTLPSLDTSFTASNSRSSVGIKQTLPALDATLTLSNELISAGMKQTLEVSVFGFHGQFPDITVNGEIIYPSGLGVILQETKTDENGIIAYNWIIDNNSGTGLCIVKIYLSKDGYFDKELETQYEIIP